MSDRPTSSEVILINSFEVAPDGVEGAIRTWERVRDFLRTQPGYLDTALHRALDPLTRFPLVNVARWQSPAHFRAAIGALRGSGGPPDQAGLAANPALYTVIRGTHDRGER